MPYYYPIQNERLRTLVMLSESIHSIPEADVQKMVMQIAGLEEEGQKAMVATLEDEQQQIEAIKRAKGITPEMEMIQIRENSAKLASIKRDFTMTVARENQARESLQAGQEAEDLLRDI
jgi:hypothetical protein